MFFRVLFSAWPNSWHFWVEEIMIRESNAGAREKIAIIGIGCRFPGGAHDYQSFWHNLISGKDCLSATPKNRYNAQHLYSKDKAKLGRLTGGRGGYIEGFDEFDPAFFGIGPREAENMDPQQRKLLEVAWEALEDAGQKPFDMAGQKVGVFVGGFTLDYKIVQFADLSFNGIAAHTATGTMMTLLSNRISYCFDFRGPSMSVDTACSSSLVTIHLACQSLMRGESSLALAGGALLHMTPQYTIAESKGGFLSPEGRSCTFDASANGYVRAEGIGLVVLKRLSDALKDGDSIHGVIIGSGCNQDGRTNGITVPNPDSQITLIRQVCKEAGIVPGDLHYVEAHGTSTPVGDPIEANALGRVLKEGREINAKCYIGSVKTNIGHTEAAAGVAGLIKTVLSLKNKIIPPHINLKNPSPELNLSSQPFLIPIEPTPWPASEGPLRAGVNSFGFGGTNAHVLLEEAPAPTGTIKKCHPTTKILPLTARDNSYFKEMAQRMRDHIASNPDEVDNVIHTLAQHRQSLSANLSFVFKSTDNLLLHLNSFLDGEAHANIVANDKLTVIDRRLVWVFTGMGPQWWAMGRQLFECESVYREVIERCDREIYKIAGWSLIEELACDEEHSNMAETWLAQPANFAMQIALAALWRSYGIKPDAIVGHSTGEAAAFYEAGVYSFEDAIKIIIHRSRLQQKLIGTGTMLAVSLSEQDALSRIAPYAGRVSIAAINSPTAMTLSGDQEPLLELFEQLQKEQIFAKFLTVKVPYHSAKMELIKDELLECLADIKAHESALPLYLTGRDTNAKGPELDAHYWWDNVRDSVRFKDAIDRLSQDGFKLFLEIGPHPVLGHAIEECLRAHSIKGTLLSSCRRQEDESIRFKRSLAALHNAGFPINWDLMSPGKPVCLPCYPWKRDRYWSEAKSVAQIRLGEVDHPLLGRRLSISDPAWEAVLDVEQQPYLSDHRIENNIMFPAAGYIEMAFQALKAMSQNALAHIGDIEFKKALFVPESEAKPVQFLFNNDTAGFTIASMPNGPLEPVIHASGHMRVCQAQGLSEPIALNEIKKKCITHHQKIECYKTLAHMGYHYGQAFSPIEEVWIGQNEALARIVPMTELALDDTPHHFHPTLLDACFQTLLASEIPLMNQDQSGIRLPLSIKEISAQEIGCRPIWAHASIKSRNTDEIIGEINVYDDEGRALAKITGFRAANVEKAGSKVNLATIDNWLTQMTWIEKPTTPSDKESTLGRWIIFKDSSPLSQALSKKLNDMKEPYILVSPGTQFQLDKESHQATVIPSSEYSIAQLFQALSDMPCKALLYLWPLDAPNFSSCAIEDLDSSKTYAPYPLIIVAQALLKSKNQAPLLVVTQGAQAVQSTDCPNPTMASLWGMCRVLWHQEMLENSCKLIDFDARQEAFEQNAEHILSEAKDFDDTEIAFRDHARYTSRLEEAHDLSHPLPLRLRADGCYLVTGAFGALGQLVCKTLIKRGARRLILMSRTRIPDRKEWLSCRDDRLIGHINFIRELEASGALVILAPVDVTKEHDLKYWLDEFKSLSMPPIRGVFHLAGQVRDTLVSDMNRDIFDIAYTPKVLGAYNLHCQLLTEPIDHFILFASIASVLTTAGQTNYAAGNAFLDALAHYRKAQGLAALSIDWGPWATGMIEELGLIDHYRNSRGMSSLSPEAGMDVLERIMGQDKAQLLVATIVDWPLFLNWYPKVPALVSDIAAQHKDVLEESGTFIDRFKAVPIEQSSSLLSDYFCQIVSDVLRIKLSQVSLNHSLNELGLDSLLAIELRARIQRELKVALPVVTLLSTATIKDIIDQLHANLIENMNLSVLSPSAQSVELFTNPKEYPLTHNQTALWFLKHLDPDGFAYNIGGAVEIRAIIEPTIMFDAVRTLIARHPSLRANFMQKDGRAVQCISDEIKEDIGLVDVENRPWHEIYNMIIKEYRKPYDLACDPLMRFRLYRLADDRWVMMKAVHHIISDAISTFTFIEELLALYEGMRRGEPIELPPVKARYLDFLNWQNKLLASPQAEKMLNYWLQHLPKEIPNLNLPTDKTRPLVLSHNGASHFFVLDEELTKKIHELAKKQGMTVFMVLLSAYYTLLHRYSGQDHVIVGSPVLGRTEEEFASVYGYFVNPLPLYADLSEKPSTLQLMEQVQKTVLNGLDNQEYPFVLLVDKLGLKHDPSRSRVFQAMFILLVHKVATTKYGYRLQYIELPEEEGQFDLTMSAYEDESEGRFHCVFKYNSDLFIASTIERMATHFVELLSNMINEPNKSIAEIPMLEASEQKCMVETWSGQGNCLQPKETIVAMFDREALKSPDNRALTMPLETGEVLYMSYGELLKKSNLLAMNLIRNGIGPQSVVAICLPKSLELIVAVLGVLKAGAAYLPLDPEYPVDRLNYMLSHAKAQCTIIDATTHSRLQNWNGICLTVQQLSQEHGDQPMLSHQISLDDMAYIIYTSGSTGRPKAVSVSHRNLSSVYLGWEDYYRLKTDVHVHAQLASFSFDVFAGDLVRALCSGGTLVLLDRNLLFNTETLYHVLLQEKVDCAEFVPAVIRGLIRYCQAYKKRLDFMRLLIVGSDAWTIDEMKQLKALCHPEHRLINSYGLSETTIDSTCFEGDLNQFDNASMVPIGKPFKNSLAYVLDANYQLTPTGVPGELWIGGLGVSNGYVSDPDMTAERFRIIQINGKSQRLYRTGDVACWDSSGILKLLGRSDNQVKIRGYRIEIGEIETHLKSMSEIADAVVTVRPNSNGESQLCAYCIPSLDHTVDVSKLRNALGNLLPVYMIPNWIQTIDAIPLSVNGKVDVKSLPSPLFELKSEDIELPQTFFESKMASHWQRLLDLDTIGLDHDFFEIGGSSIKLIELVYNLQAEFNITIAVSQLFKSTTLYGMSKTLENIIIGKESGSKAYLTFNDNQIKKLFCFPPAGGHGLVYRRLAEKLPDYTLVSFNYLMEEDKINAYCSIIEAMDPEGPYNLFGYSLGGNLAFLVAKELESRGHRINKLIMMDSYRISEQFEFNDDHLAEFEKELSSHLQKHTGSRVVAQETLEQARSYIQFCSQTLNTGSLKCELDIISDEHKVRLYDQGEKGSWHESSLQTTIHKGFGPHADMLDVDYVEQNARLTQEIIERVTHHEA